jgi:hypothetical protein
MMVEAGKVRLADTLPGEPSASCVFVTGASETFSAARPPMSQEEEVEVIAVLRDILDHEAIS